MKAQSPFPHDWQCKFCGTTVPPGYWHKCLEYEQAMEVRAGVPCALVKEWDRAVKMAHGKHREIMLLEVGNALRNALNQALRNSTEFKGFIE